MRPRAARLRQLERNACAQLGNTAKVKRRVSARRNRGYAAQCALPSGGHGARIKYILAEVHSVVDSRNNEVGPRQHAFPRATRHTRNAGVPSSAKTPEHGAKPQRPTQAESVARRALLAFGARRPRRPPPPTTPRASRGSRLECPSSFDTRTSGRCVMAGRGHTARRATNKRVAVPMRRTLSLFCTYVQYRRRVAVMSFDEMVLRAMLRLARRRVAANEGDIALRVGKTVGETEQSVRVSMRRLRPAAWHERGAGSPTRRP